MQSFQLIFDLKTSPSVVGAETQENKGECRQDNPKQLGVINLNYDILSLYALNRADVIRNAFRHKITSGSQLPQYVSAFYV